MEARKYNARILWPKGSTHLTVVALRAKLQTILKNLGRSGIASLGKGFYEFTFTSIEDANSVRCVGSWNLNPGILKLFAWTTDFKPSLVQISNTQCGSVSMEFHKSIGDLKSSLLYPVLLELLCVLMQLLVSQLLIKPLDILLGFSLIWICPMS